MEETEALPCSLLLRDLAAGMSQQMFFWGRDAVHSDGNIFIRTGFKKRPSTGIQGTSCYRLDWESGGIELHGSYAGWLGEAGGILFIRPLGRCVRWLQGEAPVPGSWPRESYDAKANEDLLAMARPFLNWWLSHEAEVARLTEDGYRDVCHRHFRKLPRSKGWLSPDLATRWVAGLRDEPEKLPRARRFAEKMAL